MQVVILGGGLGTRISAVAHGRPKSLIPVAGRPFIDWQFELLSAAGVKRVLLCLGYGGEQIRDHVADGVKWGLEVAYSWDPPTGLLGTGGALVNALPLLAEEFMVLYGDSYLPTDYGAVQRYFYEHDCLALMTVFKNLGQWDSSNTRIAAGKVTFYSKKAKPGEADYIDYGLTLWRRSVLEGYARHPLPMDLAVVQAGEVAKGRLWAFEVRERFYEIGKPAGLQELEQYLLSRKR